MFPFQTRDQILYMGQPPVVATERVTTTKTTTTTTVVTAPTLSTSQGWAFCDFQYTRSCDNFKNI